MPELPEVKTTTDYLLKQVKGYTIRSLWTDWHKYRKVGLSNPQDDKFNIYELTEPDWKHQIVNFQIDDICRIGKNIFFLLKQPDQKAVWHAHMKMTGHFLVFEADQYLVKDNIIESVSGEKIAPDNPLRDSFNKYIHLYLVLNKNKILAFSDLRKFGKFVFYPVEKDRSYDQIIREIRKNENLGPDAWNETITAPMLQEIYSKKRLPIKQALLDQTTVAGIGNIYADEILFDAKIHPLRKSYSLSPTEFNALKRSMNTIFRKAIKAGGTSERDYRLPDGTKGNFQNYLKVYRKEGLPCPRDGTSLIKRKINNRYAHFCPTCQK